MERDERKAEQNRVSEELMRDLLRKKTWPEKVRSIERMNAAMKVAQKAMSEALAKEAADK